MRKTSTFSLTLLFLAACHPGSQDASKVAPQPASQAQVDSDELQPMMERRGTSVPVHLTTTENDNLKRAVDATSVVKDSAIAHIHADAQNGQLVFVPEPTQDPSHVTADAPRITIGGPNPRTVTVVATPAAKQLLDQRTGQSH